MIFKHGSLNVPIEHHQTMIGIWSIMATFSGDVQYSQNGTVTNPVKYVQVQLMMIYDDGL